jgi:hypothetical protein
MEKENLQKYIFKFLSGFVGVITFIPLIWILFHGGSGASFASFIFWAIIVGIATIVTFKEKGNYVFPLALTLGNLATALTLLVTQQFFWGIIEWVTLVLVLICLTVWIVGNRTITLIVSTIAISLGGIPQLFLAWNHPTDISIPVWSGFLIASIFGVMAGKNWTIKERLYPVARLILYALVIILALFSSR